MARDDVKDHIIDVAAELFMQQGFAATSVRMIGDAAGVGQSSLYYHVSSKGELLAELHQSFITHLLSAMHEVETGPGTNSEKIRSIMRVVLDTVESHQARVTVFLREGHSLPDDFQAEIQKTRDEVDGVLDGILRKGIEEGEFVADLDVRLTRLAIYGMCNWSYQWFRPGGDLSSKEIADHFANIVLHGIGSD